MANKWVYLFKEGNADMRNLLGGKGANLAEMTTLGLPVPQGFIDDKSRTSGSKGLHNDYRSLHAVL